MCRDTPGDTATACYDMARSSTRVRAATWPRYCRGGLGISHDTASHRLRHGRGSATTRPGLGHDTAKPAPRYGHQRATIRSACAQGERLLHARSCPFGAGSRYKIISWLRGGDHVSRYRATRGCDTLGTTHS